MEKMRENCMEKIRDLYGKNKIYLQGKTKRIVWKNERSVHVW